MGGSLYLATRHFAGSYMVNVLELPSGEVAIALAGTGTLLEADESDDQAQTFAALLISHLNAASDIERLGVETRLKALRLASAWQRHVDDRSQGESEWLSAAQVAAHYGVTPQAVYKWIGAGRVKAEQTPGGSWRLPAEQFTHGAFKPDAAAQLKAELLERAGDLPSPSDEELAAEIIERRRS
jgi:hypothetical protein